MTVSLDTREWGRIDLDGGFGQAGSAYFPQGDYECPIAADGTFHLDGTQFRVHWPIPHSRTMTDTTLEVLSWRTIARG